MERYTDEVAARINALRKDVAVDGKVMFVEGGVALPMSVYAQPLAHPRHPYLLLDAKKTAKVLHEQHPYLKRISDWTNVVVAGGCVTRSLFGYHGYDDQEGMTDADAYVYGVRSEGHLEEIVRRLETDLRPAWMLRTNALITMCVELTKKERENTLREFRSRRDTTDFPHYVKHKIFQIILLRAERVEDVMDTFDVDECCMAFDGAAVLAHPRAVQAFSTALSRVRPELASKTLFKRLLKYQRFTSHRILCPFEATAKTYGDGAVEEGKVKSMLRLGTTRLCLTNEKKWGVRLAVMHDAKEDGAEEAEDPRDVGDYGMALPLSEVIVKVRQHHTSVCVSMVHFLLKVQQRKGGEEVRFTWNVDTTLGRMFEDMITCPEKHLPEQPMRWEREQKLFASIFPDDLLVAVVRQDAEAFGARFKAFAEAEMVRMRDTFWEAPLRLGSREELFGHVRHTAEEMIV